MSNVPFNITNCLDVTLSLNDGKNHPYRKPKKETKYIHRNSEHPPSITKEILQSTEKRLSTLSSSKNIFQELAIYHEKYLKNSEYKTKLQYQQTKKNNWNKKKGKRDVIWFNPLYSKPIKINFGRTLIKLISEHFPPNLKFVKMFMPYIR